MKVRNFPQLSVGDPSHRKRALYVAVGEQELASDELMEELREAVQGQGADVLPYTLLSLQKINPQDVIYLEMEEAEPEVVLERVEGILRDLSRAQPSLLEGQPEPRKKSAFFRGSIIFSIVDTLGKASGRSDEQTHFFNLFSELSNQQFVLVPFFDDRMIQQALRLGARGCFALGQPLESLCRMVLAAAPLRGSEPRKVR